MILFDSLFYSSLPCTYEEVECVACSYSVHLMSLTLMRVDSLRPNPLSLPIGSASVKSDQCVVKEEARQEVQVYCREGISLVLTASSSELQSPPTATSEAEENQPLTFFTTNATALAVGPANFAGVDSVKKGNGEASSSFFPPLPLRGCSNLSEGGVPLPAGNGGSFTTIVVPRETLVPYDPPQSPCTGRVQAGKKRKKRLQYIYTIEKGVHEIEVSESESDEESSPSKKKDSWGWGAEDNDEDDSLTFEAYMDPKTNRVPREWKKVANSNNLQKSTGGLFAAKQPSQKAAPSKGKPLPKKTEMLRTVFEW